MTTPASSDMEFHKVAEKGQTTLRGEPIDNKALLQSVRDLNDGKIHTRTTGQRPSSSRRLGADGYKAGPLKSSSRSPYNWAETWGYPYNCVGKVFCFQGGSNDGPPYATATGVLVGRRVLLTASHILPNGGAAANELGQGTPAGSVTDEWTVTFVPGFNDSIPGTDWGTTTVLQYHYLTDNILESGIPTENDIAVCLLADPLGDTCGWWGSESRGYENDYIVPGYFQSVGYLEGADTSNAQDLYFFNIQLTFAEPLYQASSADNQQAQIPNSSPDDLNYRNFSLRSNQYAGAAWTGGPIWYDAQGAPADAGDGSTDASIATNNSEELPVPRVVGILSGNFNGGDGLQAFHAGGILMVNLIKHYNTQFP